MNEHEPLTSREYKEAAKRVLAGNWGRVILLLLAASVCGSILPEIVQRIYARSMRLLPLYVRLGRLPPGFGGYAAALLASTLPVLILAPGSSAIAAKPYFGHRPGLADVFFGFRHLPHVLGAMLLLVLRIALAMVVCMLPAFIALFAGIMWQAATSSLGMFYMFLYTIGFAVFFTRVLYYVAVPLLLVLHPTLTIRQTFARSREIMRDRRSAFVRLMLSFFGWALLLGFGVTLLSQAASLLPPMSAPATDAAEVLISLVLTLLTLPLIAWMNSATAAFLLHADGMDIFGSPEAPDAVKERDLDLNGQSCDANCAEKP